MDKNAEKLFANIFLKVRRADGSCHTDQFRVVCLRNPLTFIYRAVDISDLKSTDLPCAIAWPANSGNTAFMRNMLYKFCREHHIDAGMSIISVKWQSSLKSSPHDLLINFRQASGEHHESKLFNH